MIKSIIASTREIDDEKAAVAEILSAINPGKNLLKNSLGLISCFSAFEETGVLKAICDALPFECIGSTSCLCAGNNEIDQIILVITVLTSDDCSFKSEIIHIEGDFKSDIGSGMKKLMSQSGEKPKLLLTYFPLKNEIVSGDDLLAAIDHESGGIPLFGTVAIDHNMDYASSKTIHNGEMYEASLVICALYGKPNFSFGIASFDENLIRSQKAIITESRGNVLMGINGKPAMEYFREIGLTADELATGLGVIPLVLDYKDGTLPIGRAVFSITPENHVICGGVMPENMALTISRIDMDDVVRSAERSFKSIMADDCVILSFSCMARYMALGNNNQAEVEMIRDLAGNTDYLYACSGGEICPLPDANGKLKNHYHNYTNVFCRLS
jgi:hypothetical protein